MTTFWRDANSNCHPLWHVLRYYSHGAVRRADAIPVEHYSRRCVVVQSNVIHCDCCVLNPKAVPNCDEMIAEHQSYHDSCCVVDVQPSDVCTAAHSVDSTIVVVLPRFGVWMRDDSVVVV